MNAGDGMVTAGVSTWSNSTPPAAGVGGDRLQASTDRDGLLVTPAVLGVVAWIVVMSVFMATW